MYATCIFCHAPLGGNEIVETFPVGRRLAFDPERGRLWAVCLRCGRWNLSPIEERWEALEELERRFRQTPLRASTEHVGLAKVGEGLELIRIGRPALPEFAAWRYGQQFGRRRVRQAALVGGGAVAVGALYLGGPAMGLAFSGVGAIVNVGMQGAVQWWQRRRVIARVDLDDGRRVALAAYHAANARLHPDADAPDGWRLELPYIGSEHIQLLRGGKAAVDSALLTGDRARRAVTAILPSVNRGGGGQRVVGDAVRLIENAGSPDRYFALAARAKPATNYSFSPRTEPVLASLPPVVRLALEMASHEESERRALDGELALLETAWREAEEIAAIADDMFLPASVTAWLERQRARRDTGSRD